MQENLRPAQASHVRKGNKTLFRARAYLRAMKTRLRPELPYDDDPKWNASFARSLDVLDRLSQEAHEDYLAGRTEPCDPTGDEV